MTIEMKQALSLPERAADALAQFERNQLRLREERAEREREKHVKLLKRLLLQRLGIEAEPDMPVIEIDGLVFGARERIIYGTYDYELFLIGECVNCGAEVWSQDIDHLPVLGAILQNWPLPCRGGCYDPAEDEPAEPFPAPPPVTPTDRLVDALRDVIAEETRYA